MRSLFFYFLCCLSIGYSQYSLKTEHIGGAKNSADENIFRATLVKDGSALTTIERTLPFDVPFPSVSLNESTGMFILNYPFDGFVEVYNASGKKLWEQNFFKEKKPNYERTITVALGISSAAFLTSDVTLPNAIVHRFTTAGTPEWETALPYSMGYEIALSPDEKTIVAGTYSASVGDVKQSTTILNSKGTITGTADILFRSASFNSGGDHIAFASEKEIMIYDVNARKATARTEKKTGDVISNIIWAGTDILVQESSVRTPADGPFYFSDPVVIRYSSALNEIGRNAYPLEQFKQSSLTEVSGSVILHCDAKEMKVE